jgi:hypothetical protein
VAGGDNFPEWVCVRDAPPSLGAAALDTETHHDLSKPREIRNKFAHVHEPLKFIDAPIGALCAKLQTRATGQRRLIGPVDETPAATKVAGVTGF